MTQTSSEVVIGADAQLYVGAVNSTAPTNSYGAPNAAFADLGYVTEDGLTITDSRTTFEVRSLQEFYPIRRGISSRDFRVAFVLQQWNEDTVDLAFGGGTLTYVGGEWKYVPPAPSEVDDRAFIFDWQDGSTYWRLYVPKALVVENVETRVTRTAEAQLPITISVTPVSSSTDPWTLFSSSSAFGS